MSGTAKATVHIDNERVIVTEYRFQRGDNTGWHRHGHDYVIVPLLDGKLKIVNAEGESIAEMKGGVPYFRKEGVEHDVINATAGVESESEGVEPSRRIVVRPSDS